MPFKLSENKDPFSEINKIDFFRILTTTHIYLALLFSIVQNLEQIK